MDPKEKTYNKSTSKELIDYLKSFVSKNRLDLFSKVIQNRTKYLCVALEDIYQSQNASAVLRSCDCFGVQDVYIIENKNEYNINPDVSLGAEKWLNLQKFNSKSNNSLECIKQLKNKGYRIIATSPHKKSAILNKFDLNKGKTALFFGTELTGLSSTILENADEFLKIPMFGFSESFNISVSTAIILHYLSVKLKESEINWKLSPNEKNEILLNWLKTTIKSSNLIIERFYSK